MLCLLLAPVCAAAAEWTLLPLPRATRSSGASPAEDVLLDAAHLDVDGRFRPAAAEIQEPLIPPAVFQQMLDESLRVRGLRLETRPQAGLLLARGEAAALDAARALSVEIDRQADAFAIQLDVVLRRDGAPAASWSRRVRAGADVFLGARTARPFLAGFDIQVAQDAGQAAPRLGTALAGTGLHVRAARVGGGARVFLDGLFDSAEIQSIERFDPQTPDLGILEQPRIASTQIAFAGAVESGGTLEVRLASAGPVAGELVLQIRASTSPDASSADDAWMLFDLSFAAAPPRALLPVDPGLGLDSPARESAAGAALLLPAALAALLEPDRASDPRAARSPVHWSGSVLCLPRSDTARIAAARALLGALEHERAAAQRVTLACGPLQASFPVAPGRPARFTAGVERPYLSDYGLEVAPQVWMPAPRVERAFDGLALDLALEDGVLAVWAWRAATTEVVVLERDAAQMGRLELARRARVAGAARTAPGQEPARLFDEGPPLVVSSGAP
ncbi:MAG: hypothetical protein JNK02_15265 [Planctomycetes bacterium]|nr:hypothetical protein [Planctomycetota bacterium]